MSVASVSRSTGRSAPAAAAYRAGPFAGVLVGPDGRAHDYTRRSGVVSAVVLAPSGCEWAENRQALWTAAEQAENRKDAKVAREIVLGLPAELDPVQRGELALEMARYLVNRYGVAVDLAVHLPTRRGDQRNHHAHLLATTRMVGPDGLGPKTRVLDVAKSSSAEIAGLREAWAGMTNAALERAGVVERITHLSHHALGDGLLPTRHLGPIATGLERGGVDTPDGDHNRAVRAANAIMPLRVLRDALEVQIARAKAHERRMEHFRELLGIENGRRMQVGSTLLPKAERNTAVQAARLEAHKRRARWERGVSGTDSKGDVQRSGAVDRQRAIKPIQAQWHHPAARPVNLAKSRLPGRQAEVPIKQMPSPDQVLALVGQAGGGAQILPEIRFRHVRTDVSSPVAMLANQFVRQPGVRHVLDEATSSRYLILPLAALAAAGTSRSDLAAMLWALRLARATSRETERREAREADRAREDKVRREAEATQSRLMEARYAARMRRARPPVSAEVQAILGHALQAEPGALDVQLLRRAADTNGPVAQIERDLAHDLLPYQSESEPNGLRKLIVPFSSLVRLFWGATLSDAMGARKRLSKLVRLLRAARWASRAVAKQALQAARERFTPTGMPSGSIKPNWTIPGAAPTVIPAVAPAPIALPKQPAGVAGVAAAAAGTVGTGAAKNVGEVQLAEAVRQAALRWRKAAEEEAAEQRRLSDQSAAPIRPRPEPAQPTRKADQPPAVVDMPEAPTPALPTGQRNAVRRMEPASTGQIEVPNTLGGPPPPKATEPLSPQTARYTIAEADQLLRGGVVQIDRKGIRAGFLVTDPGRGEPDPERLDVLLAKEGVWAAHSENLPRRGMEWLSYRVIDLAEMLAGLARDVADRWIERLRAATKLTVARRTALAEARAARDAKPGATTSPTRQIPSGKDGNSL